MAIPQSPAAALTAPLRLRDLHPGEHVRVLGYAQASPYGRRLTHLGLTVGTPLLVMRRAPVGDPVVIRLRGHSLALRTNEADRLLLDRA